MCVCYVVVCLLCVFSLLHVLFGCFCKCMLCVSMCVLLFCYMCLLCVFVFVFVWGVSLLNSRLHCCCCFCVVLLVVAFMCELGVCCVFV